MRTRMILAVALMGSFVAPAEIQASEPSRIGQAESRYVVIGGTSGANFEPVVRRHRRYVARRSYSGPRYVVKRRSKAKSAAIIGGSAAAGAGIGALAGGGKGAGIGAIAGGAAGLIYDRKTPKKVVREY